MVDNTAYAFYTFIPRPGLLSVLVNYHFKERSMPLFNPRIRKLLNELVKELEKEFEKDFAKRISRSGPAQEARRAPARRARSKKSR